MAKQGSLFVRFRSFDAYAKTLDDFRVKTTMGAMVTVFSAIVIAFLVLSELIAYRTPSWRPELVVDKSRKEKMMIRFNVTFPKMPCHMLSLDIMDDSGEHITGYSHDVYKVRLDLAGQEIESEKANKLGDTTHGAEKALAVKDECGSCYGASSGCCNTCEEVRQAYVEVGWGFGDPDKIEQCVREGWRERIEKQSNEGCNLHGQLLVNKVKGNFHIAPGSAFQSSTMHIHDLQSFLAGAPDGHAFDLSHSIHSLKFGPDTDDTNDVVALTNPLGGTVKTTDQVRTMYQYFLKIVSTELQPLNGPSTFTNQYSITQNERVLDDHATGLPGVFFLMDISPMLIIYRESRPSLTSFITGVFAIVGGIFTVAGLVDRVMYRAERSFKKKVELGKAL
ncbi:Endoplasmic reticulum-Golgi intermediate compartment protein 3 [Apophysomyces sp. BC1034]|nr:Endoplasmic reticulum-Golgi intermediate compartment protein 3 [Apophysomyces sp. BC1015]KAG0180482.1 Endoplasmic reticulum-Golgi intermediate compartment protein 3 [Apophysomyces sp. BC1021]KAG0191011.1 Endoplasmic reticulum-Golgi intermediate compartment protein 3 [Apophysomyces sp. BC1034]